MTLLEFGKFLWGNPVIDVYITDNPEGFNQESVYSGTFEYLPVKYATRELLGLYRSTDESKEFRIVIQGDKDECRGNTV